MIFINDLPWYLENVITKMFADDTTLYASDYNLPTIINTFDTEVGKLLEWCSSNRMDINWKKTFGMFITNKRIELPSVLKVANIEIEIVTSF